MGLQGRKYWFLLLQGQKIFIFGVPGNGNIDFWCFGIGDWKILIFGAPEAPTKGGDPSTCQNLPESFEKTTVLGGEATGGDGGGGILDPLKH